MDNGIGYSGVAQQYSSCWLYQTCESCQGNFHRMFSSYLKLLRHIFIHVANISKGIYWGGVVITAIFFAFRIYVRLKAFRRVYSDDLLVLAAWLMLLTSAIIWQFDKESLYEQMELTSGQLLPSAGFEHRVEKALRGSLVEIVFFYSSLWSVKVSFLIFFRRLGHKVKGQKQLWWFVLIVTLASYIVCLSLINYNCLASTSLSSLGPQTPLYQMKMAESSSGLRQPRQNSARST